MHPEKLVKCNLLCCQVGDHQRRGGMVVSFAYGMFSDKFSAGVGDLFLFSQVRIRGLELVK